MQDKKEEHDIRVEYPPLGWYNQQLYQLLALNCKGEALAMVEASTAGEYESKARSDSVVSFGSRPRWVQRATNTGTRLTSSPTSTLSENVGCSSHIELRESRIREYDTVVYQTEKIQTKVPDSCEVFIVRSLVPKDMEKDLLKIHSTANYKATKDCILGHASLKKKAHFHDKETHTKPVPMDVEALLAKVIALKTGLRQGVHFR